MTLAKINPTKFRSWKSLENQYKTESNTHISDFGKEEDRIYEWRISGTNS